MPCVYAMLNIVFFMCIICILLFLVYDFVFAYYGLKQKTKQKNLLKKYFRNCTGIPYLELVHFRKQMQIPKVYFSVVWKISMADV